MHRVSRAALAAAAARWRPRLADLPEPRIAVMLGGHVGPWTFDAAQGARARAAGRRHGPRAGRLAPDLDQRAHAARRRRRRRGRARPPRTGSTAGAATTPTTPISASSPWPTGSWSPATACRCWSRPPRPPSRSSSTTSPTRPAAPRSPCAGSSSSSAGSSGPRQLARDVTAIHRASWPSGRAVSLGQSWPDTAQPHRPQTRSWRPLECGRCSKAPTRHECDLSLGQAALACARAKENRRWRQRGRSR